MRLNSALYDSRAKILGLSDREVARRSGVHYVTISRWRSGSAPGIDSLAALAQVLGVDRWSDLVEDSPEK